MRVSIWLCGKSWERLIKLLKEDETLYMGVYLRSIGCEWDHLIILGDVHETYLVSLIFEFLGDRISCIASLGDIDNCPGN